MFINNCAEVLGLPQEILALIHKNNIKIEMANSREELLNLAVGGADNVNFDVSFDVPGRGVVRELEVTRCKNGVVANFDDIYMRRRDPDSMVIADDAPTDKPTHEERFGVAFDGIRKETLTWLFSQETLLIIPFISGNAQVKLGYPSLAILPANAAFFGAVLADLQGFIPYSELPYGFAPSSIIYVAPPFRHRYYDGKQIVVHNRLPQMHEIFSFNLYPGPSAKKGIYGVLLNKGERENWTTLHASTVRIITPYENTFTILHEGASGGGKSEMTQAFHRQHDGRVLLSENMISKEKIWLSIAESSELNPVTDDMALAHPSLQKSRKLTVADAESGWFLRVNHITEYGTEPETEKLTIHPPEPLTFMNLNATANASCLIWDAIDDAPGIPCPNPRVIVPRRFIAHHVDEPCEVDVRSFGIRTPPCTREMPTYGIVGMFHVLPPALAWLWRLVSPRGYNNPSIIASGEMSSEGVGSYWPFATGKKVKQANILLEQILNTPSTRYVLIPNQYIGAYKVGFAGQWMVREYLARRGGLKFREGILQDARCPLLGYVPEGIKIEGQLIPKRLMMVEHQREVGEEGYDAGAKILQDFFNKELEQFLTPELNPLGTKIINACLHHAAVHDYFELIPKL